MKSTKDYESNQWIIYSIFSQEAIIRLSENEEDQNNKNTNNNNNNMSTGCLCMDTFSNYNK